MIASAGPVDPLSRYGVDAIVPMGMDCVITSILLEKGLRKGAYPFDWALTFCGVAAHLSTSLSNVLSPAGRGDETHPVARNTRAAKPMNRNGDLFWHHMGALQPGHEDAQKLRRRVNRLQELLVRSHPAGARVVFMRLGHHSRHHRECLGPRLCCDEVADAESMLAAVRQKYPRARCTMLLVLRCCECHGLCTKTRFSKRTVTRDADLTVMCHDEAAKGNEFDPSLAGGALWKDGAELCVSKYLQTLKTEHAAVGAAREAADEERRKAEQDAKDRQGHFKKDGSYMWGT